MKKAVALVAALALWPTVAYATSLSSAAASIGPGQFAEVTGMSNFTAAINDAGNNRTTFSFTDKGWWDRNAKCFYFVGEGHLANMVFIRYCDATNTWTIMPTPPFFTTFWHAYESNTGNESVGRYYVKDYSPGVMHAYDTTNNVWLSNLPGFSNDLNVASAAEYFPARGTLVVLTDPGTGASIMTEYNGSSWSTLATGCNSTGGTGYYQNFLRYNPVQQILIGGGGNGRNTWCKVNAAGQVTSMPPFPGSGGFNVGTPGATMQSVDPVTGDFLVWGPAGDFWKFVFQTNTWTRLSSIETQFPARLVQGSSNGMSGMLAFPIPNYGVTGYLVCGGVPDCEGVGGTVRFYIYKHAAGGPAGPAANPPTGLVVR
jgi:hypothetical protein